MRPILLTLLLTSCGYDTDCFNGCDNETIIVERHTEISGPRGPAGDQGPAGEVGTVGEKGEDGKSIVGPKGDPGQDAEPCTVVQPDAQTAIILCPDGTSATLTTKKDKKNNAR